MTYINSLNQSSDLNNIDCLLGHSSEEIMRFLIPLSQDYPEIFEWFHTKVIPGALCGTRKLILKQRNNEIVALGIAKKEDAENKICTVRVAHEYVGKGLGVRVFDELLEWLNVSKPLLTVSEYKYPQFKKLFEHYGFVLTSINDGMYLPGKKEFIFNEHTPLNHVRSLNSGNFLE